MNGARAQHEQAAAVELRGSAERGDTLSEWLPIVSLPPRCFSTLASHIAAGRGPPAGRGGRLFDDKHDHEAAGGSEPWSEGLYRLLDADGRGGIPREEERGHRWERVQVMLQPVALEYEVRLREGGRAEKRG